MNYISAEEFLEQPEEVRKTLLDWWKPVIGEKMYSTGISLGECILLGEFGANNYYVICLKSNERARVAKNVLVPLLTETQLRKFIEKKTNSKIESEYYYKESKGYDVWLYTGTTSTRHFDNLGHDLLMAYWKAACQIAQEE